MGDLIDRQSVIDAITNAADKFDWPDDYHQAMKEGIRIGTLICSLMPSKQPEIIHCRDCKHWREDHTCREHSLVSPMMAYEFCSRAERREVSE